jgi:hypothetical protein
VLLNADFPVPADRYGFSRLGLPGFQRLGHKPINS